MNWEIRTDIYTLVTVCIKWITNEKLRYSTGNSPQCSAVTYMGRRSKREELYVHIANSLYCTVGANTTL